MHKKLNAEQPQAVLQEGGKILSHQLRTDKR